MQTVLCGQVFNRISGIPWEESLFLSPLFPVGCRDFVLFAQRLIMADTEKATAERQQKFHFHPLRGWGSTPFLINVFENSHTNVFLTLS